LPARAQSAGPPVAARTLHNFPLGSPRIDSDGQAKAIVNEILLKILGVTNTNWEITITEDDRDTANAVARYWPPPIIKREIVFNKEFLNKVAEGGAGKWPAYCVAAHEIGHLLRLHLENTNLTTAAKLRNAELEADYYCGFVLGKMDSSYGDTVAAIHWYTPVPNYPTRDERVAQIGRGWTEATGKATPSRGTVVATATQGPEPPAASAAVANVLSKFVRKDNRDIYGHDIVPAGGKAGIPGLSMQACAARCDAERACKAFSFDRWNGWCFLKDAIVTSRLDPPSTIAVKRPAQLPKASKAAAQMLNYRGRRFRDVPFEQQHVEDFQTCRNACESNLSCVAFTFLKKTPTDNNNCQMFRFSDGYYSDPSADSGIKQQAPP
jgi:hypothetical protein